jgi:hypothetical protein
LSLSLSVQEDISGAQRHSQNLRAHRTHRRLLVLDTLNSLLLHNLSSSIEWASERTVEISQILNRNSKVLRKGDEGGRELRDRDTERERERERLTDYYYYCLIHLQKYPDMNSTVEKG